ncbi:ABC transporter ATP-binding protein [Roseateles violae]|uniref:ABC transporter ATP-binding protein n=1 Tax=Roseateles violae TaxID=3058042 RepID=A0ABT8DUI6_9BURK|nr:ABC transporter ATP-binding protein [Pelomonas sp. PFR6]MDN3921971.1 ABC transporter ATP-binding protein [Pelomonas sp. PFR6]
MLEVSGLQAGYGGSQVLFDLDLTVRAGEVVTLLGRNGMGKSTTLRCLSGWMSPSAGRIRFAGEDVTGWPADRIARLGLAIVPEGRQVFPNLTVLEHLQAFAANRSGAGAERWTVERLLALFPRLKERGANMGNQLSGGEQQMLAIARALVTNPKLMILDEATEGLAPLIREEIWRCLDALRAAGQTILVVDKYVRRLIRLADRHSIVERGRVVWAGDSAALAADPGLWQRYLGVGT